MENISVGMLSSVCAAFFFPGFVFAVGLNLFSPTKNIFRRGYFVYHTYFMVVLFPYVRSE